MRIRYLNQALELDPNYARAQALLGGTYLEIERERWLSDFAMTRDEAINKANDSIYGLGSSVWTRDLDRARQAAERIEAGYTWINSAQIIFDQLPFGGLKQSGLGKEHGEEALDHYMETKSVVVGHP